VTTALCIPPNARGERINQHVVIGTPGSLIGKLRNGDMDGKNVVVVVIDEADQMIEVENEGMGSQTMQVVGYVPKSIQILLFSATYPDRVRAFAKKIAADAVRIIVKREQLSLDGIKQYWVECKDQAHKFDALSSLYGVLSIGQSIIFVHTRVMAQQLCRKMRDRGYSVSLLHGADMQAQERDRVMDDFREGKTTVLISTNVLARGIDVLQVTLVVNYDLPLNKNNMPDPETYIHRIGRSGRFGRRGAAINFIHDEASRATLQTFANHFGVQIQKLPIEDVDKVQKIVKKAVKG
jgi:ATP-dependent RNA helicase DDX19/DBP5